MERSWLIVACLLVAAAIVLASPADAQCAINFGSVSMSPATASTGIYTPPTTLSYQVVTLAVSGTYTSLLGGICTISLAFNRASLPASMARFGGGATYVYGIDAAAGGPSLLYSGGGIPSNRATASFSAGILGLGRPFSANLTAMFLAQPTTPQQEGSYSDSVTANFFNGTGGGTSDVGSQSFTVTGSVLKSCTIGGSSNPGADSAIIPVSGTGVVNTAPIGRSYVSAVCNSLTNLQVTSQFGAVKRTAAAPGGFTNLINYAASATYSGASSALDTATVPTASGAEAGTVGTTSAATSSGTISLTISPEPTLQPLVPGNYLDTLTISITPQ